MKKLIVIDSGNIMHKGIFAFRNNPQIQPVYTYLRMILGYLRRLGVTLDDKVIIAQDYGSWRKEIDPLYKAQRKAFREGKEDADWWKAVYSDFNEFIPKLDKCMPWHFPKIYKMESDDLASVAVRFLDDYDEKILVSSDEDWQQLCSIPNVKVFSPYSKKFKIVKNPEKILLKKIRGDISDNLLEAPKNEKEYEKRKMIVDLLHLPDYIEQPIKEVILNLPVKSLYLEKIPFRSCKTIVKELYHL